LALSNFVRWGEQPDIGAVIALLVSCFNGFTGKLLIPVICGLVSFS